LRREMGDLLSIGTMICGASAINALSPVIFAHRRDQGLAISAVFLFSEVALLVYYPLAQMLGLSDEFGGLWAGLAVNDLSGAVVVGSQFGESAEVIAAASKSVRIMLLGPILIFFTVLRPTTRGDKPERKKSKWLAHFPKFILGYFVFFGLRIFGDANFGDSAQWALVLEGNRFLVKLLILCVCAGVGLQLRFRTIIEVGWKAVVVGAFASVVLAGLTLGMLLCFTYEMHAAAVGVGAVGLALSLAIYKAKSSDEMVVLHRLKSGSPLSMREAITALETFDRSDDLNQENCGRVLRQLYPAIGELQPLRTTELVPPIQYRRLIYWESERGNGSLVGILWAPGAEAHIHSHGFHGLGKTIEGRIEESLFERLDGGRLRLASRSNVDPEEIMNLSPDDIIHAVRNTWEKAAIHIHYYGPEEESGGLRFDPLAGEILGEMKVGDEFAVQESEDVLPQHVLGSIPRAASA